MLLSLLDRDVAYLLTDLFFVNGDKYLWFGAITDRERSLIYELDSSSVLELFVSYLSITILTEGFLSFVAKF